MHTAHGDTQKQVADYIGITEQTLSAKVNGETDFKHSEIKLLIDRYRLTPEQVDQIFFWNGRESVLWNVVWNNRRKIRR